MRRCLLVACLLTASLAFAEKRASYRLCVSSMSTVGTTGSLCRNLDSLSRQVELSSDDRLYMWTTDDGWRAALGVVNPQETVLSPSVLDKKMVRFRLRSGSKFWPEPVEITVNQSSSHRSWVWSVPGGKEPEIQIAFPDGAYDATFRAAHHYPLTVNSNAVRSSQTLALVPHPMIVGRVVEKATRQGLPGATISDEESTLLASVTEMDGGFQFELERSIPKELRIGFVGRATSVIALKNEGDVDIGIVELSKGATVTLALPSNIREHSDIELLEVPNEGERRPIRRLTTQDASPTVFRDLAAGSYQVVVSRSELEKVGVRFELSEGEEKQISVPASDVELRLAVRDRRGPVRATVRLMNQDERWSGEITTDENGHFQGHIWQEGKYTAIVNVEQRSTPFGANRRLVQGDSFWEIEVKGTKFEGVVKSPAGGPVVGARVDILSEWPTGQQRRRVTTNDAGSFAADFVPPGSQALRVTAEGFLPFDTSFQTVESDVERDFDIHLKKGQLKVVHVVSRDNVPLPNAVLYESISGSTLRTGSDGIGTIPLPDGAVCEVFVIPADGSLATATVRANDENENIVVPPGDAILRIRIEDETGTPVPGVTLLLRANGYFVPLEVMNLIAPGAPFSLRTDANGYISFNRLPIGVYDIWAVFDWSRLGDFAMSPPPPVAQIAAQAGVNDVTVVVKREVK